MSTKPGRDEQAVGVDRALGRAADLADLGDHTAVDRDVGRARRRAGAVDDRAAADDRLVRRSCVARFRSRSAGRSSPVSSWSAVRACSRSARKLAPVITNRSRPRSARPRRRSAHTSGAPTTAKRSTNSGFERRGVRGRVAQVLVAVVAAADLGDDLAVGLGQAGAGRAGHRREVRERGDRRR